jgi:choline-glycine betaine transporter
MIGQFVSRFVGGLKTWQLLGALLIFPSIPLAMWFSVLYYYHLNGIGTAGLPNWAMTIVGIVFVINSFDSLIRLYTDNLNLTTERFGTASYVLANTIGLFVLTLLFQSQWLQIQWVGSVVIVIYLLALAYMFFVKPEKLSNLDGNPVIEAE